MSDKQASVVVPGVLEDSDKPVQVRMVVDYINPGNVYLEIDGRESVAIANRDIWELFRFVNREAR